MTAQSKTLIRIGEHTIHLVQPDKAAPLAYETETLLLKTGISQAANLREAFKSSALLARRESRAQVLVEAPLMVIPIDEFDEADCQTVFYHAYEPRKGHTVLHSIVPELRCAVLFEVSRDLQTVLGDHFSEVQIMPLMQPLWTALHRKSLTGLWRKMYAYFHDKRMELFCFDKNRFRFVNQFDAKHTADNVYYVLYAWQQMGLNVERDELHLLGTPQEADQLTQELRRFLQKVQTDSTSALFPTLSDKRLERLPADIVPML